MSTLKVDTIQDTNAVEMYLCKAWVNFDGTQATASDMIRGSGNVSSITDGGTGIYTVNFTNSFDNANYSTIVTCRQAEFAGMDLPTTSSVTVYCVRRTDSLTRSDNQFMNVAVFR
jgi:hypothetical protein